MAALRLLAIAFNHDSSTENQDALNVRRNLIQASPVPEWQDGISTLPQDSCAAYAVAETAGNVVTVRAKFRCFDLARQKAEVRAIGATGGVLGCVKAGEVTFGPQGESDFTLFELENTLLDAYGVGVHLVRWWWQFRFSPDSPWVTFARTDHQIYTLLALPTLPWQQEDYPFNTQIPWIEVLDHACRWAQGAKTPERAATRITQVVYDLGPERLEYNCPNVGAPMYVMPDSPSVPGFFFCTAFLDLLAGGRGAGRYVNCSDCATIVSTFANALGCDLSQARMGTIPGFFFTNPVVPIGESGWSVPCGVPGFGMHEVAWTGACGEEDSVYDACLVVDADENPGAAPHFPLLPAGIRFGRPGEPAYRARLATAASVGQCHPIPNSRQRRRVI